MQEFVKSLYQVWRVVWRLALRSVELSVSHQLSVDTLTLFSTFLLSCLFSSLPPPVIDFTVKICSLISPFPYFIALWWHKQDLVALKVERTIIINATAFVFTLNQFDWPLILWQSNLILYRQCGSEKKILLVHNFLKFLFGHYMKRNWGVTDSNATLGFVVAIWGYKMRAPVSKACGS